MRHCSHWKWCTHSITWSCSVKVCARLVTLTDDFRLSCSPLHTYFSPKCEFWGLTFSLTLFSSSLISSCVLTLFSFPCPLSFPPQCSLGSSFQSSRSQGCNLKGCNGKEWLLSWKVPSGYRLRMFPQAQGRSGHFLFSSLMLLYQISEDHVWAAGSNVYKFYMFI